MHADLARLNALRDPAGEVADSLVEAGLALPPVSADEHGERFRAELRALLAEHATGDPARPYGDGGALHQAMAGRGYFGMGWPAAHSGREASVAEQVMLNEEIQYHRAPVGDALNTVMLLGNSILRHGTQEQKAEFLPRMRRGEIRFCLGYSEPETGSDLASLRTRAVQDGQEWVINGQKSWTTNAHIATHVWLARVGQVNGGWRVIIDALAGERVVMGGELAEEFGEAILDLLGPEAALAEPHPGSPFPPTLEYQLRLALMFVIGGGTNDIQRGMIARALGLPR